MSPKLYILAGIPGSGKTTWAKNYLGDCDWISSDDIREEICGGEYDRERNNEVFDVFHHRIDTSLSCAMNVVADATFLSSDARRIVRSIAERNDAETHLILFQNLGQAVLRNMGRKKGRVPEDAMLVMLEKYEMTECNLPFERYNSVTYIGGFA